MEVDVVLVMSRWLHLGAVIVAVGGAVFAGFVLGPAAAAVLDDDAHERLRGAVRQRWRRFVHGCIAVILLSGLYNAYATLRGGQPPAYHLLFTIKLLAALGVFFLASALVGRSAAFEAMRTRPRGWITWITVLAAVIVALSGVLHAMR